jgi:DNA-binding MarR family transcriptional regulator
VRRVPHPTDRRTILARLTPEGDDLAERATKALAGIGYGLGDVSAACASQVTAALRRIRQAIGDLGR